MERRGWSFSDFQNHQRSLTRHANSSSERRRSFFLLVLPHMHHAFSCENLWLNTSLLIFITHFTQVFNIWTRRINDDIDPICKIFIKISTNASLYTRKRGTSSSSSCMVFCIKNQTGTIRLCIDEDINLGIEKENRSGGSMVKNSSTRTGLAL